MSFSVYSLLSVLTNDKGLMLPFEQFTHPGQI